MLDKHYDLVTIGNYTKDTIVTAAGTRYVDGGGYSYAAHAAALAGLRVAALTRLAAGDRARVVAPLEAKGVDVFVHECAGSTLMRLEYPTSNVDERVLSVAGLADPITPELVEGLSARAVLVSASIRGEAPLALLECLRATGAWLGADAQGFVRIVGPGGLLQYGTWPEQAAVLGLLDVLKTDAVEAEFLTGHADIRAAATALAAFGPREIVLTHRDGLLVLADGVFHSAEFHPVELRGRSGRGDTCVGSYMASRLSADPARATVWAAAATSLKMEQEGPVRCSRADVEALIAARYS